MPCSDCSPTFTAHAALNKFKPSLFSRVRFNQPPLVASERSELTKLVSHAEGELAGYDRAIEKLRQIALALENRKQSLHRQISLAKSLLAPVRKLPPEILCQIFIEHGTENFLVYGGHSNSSVIPGFKIACVCSHWRSVALTTTELWNSICVVIRPSDCMWWYPDAHSALSERLLELSATSPLSVILNIPGNCYIPAVPYILRLLCRQANRWKALRGVCNIASILCSGIDGRRLDSLETFKLAAPPKVTALCIENAPKLHAVALILMDTKQITVPWDQITDLTVGRSSASQIVQSLAKMPKLSKLLVLSCDDEFDDEDEYDHRLVQSHLDSLTIIIRRPLDELAIAALLDALILPKLQSLSIISERGHITNQDECWASNQLPSSILRSSPPLTSFKLEKTWMPSNDLIALLQNMPTLTTVYVSEPSHKEPMINDQLIVNLSFRPDQQPLLKHLASLTLAGCRLSSFSVKVFVEMILSRWKPSYLIQDGIICMRTAKLHVSDGSISFPDVVQLMELRDGGLDIMIEDEDGDVLFGARSHFFSVPRQRSLSIAPVDKV